MRVADHLELYELHRLAAEESSAVVRLRLQAVILALQGQTALQIAMAVSSNRRSVQEWVRWYNVLGITGLADRPHTGRGTILPRTREADLCRRLDSGATAADGVCTLRAADVRRILEREFGVVYALPSVYKLLHRLGYSSLAPRPRHKLADPAAQEAFKKTRSLRYRKSNWLIRTSVSRSGSRMKPALASRER